MQRDQMKIGGHYNWKNQPERLLYLGRNWSGNGYWHQFALTSNPEEVWCEVLDDDLERFEQTVPIIDIGPALIEHAATRKKPDRQAFPQLSARQARKARKAAKRAAQAADAPKG